MAGASKPSPKGVMLYVADEMMEHGSADPRRAQAAPGRAAGTAAPFFLQSASERAGGPDASRYGARRRPNLPAVALVVLIHAVLIAALIQVRHSYVRASEKKMVVVNLTPPPPPPAAEVPPPPAQPDVVAPPPIVQTPVPPRPQVQTTPEPTPISVPVASAVPAAPAPAAPSRPAGPSTVQAGDLGAQMLSGRAPRYPIESRRKREQGTVLLALVVGLDGRVMSIAVARSSGFARLDDAALDAVRGWRWSPIIRDGQPVMVKGVVEIPFIITPSA